MNNLLKMMTAVGLFLLVATAARAATTDTLALVTVEKKINETVKTDNHIDVSLSAAYINSGNESLQQATAAWIDKRIAGLTGISTARMTDASAENLLGYFSQQFFLNSKKEILATIKRTPKAERHPINYSLDIKVNRIYETSQLITFKLEAYVFTAGAHGMESVEYASFRKSDGYILTWDDVATKKTRPLLCSLIVEGVESFFGTNSLAGLKGKLLIKSYSAKNFPFPASYPGFTQDGLKAQYARYEIAPYAAGAPLSIIPYSRLSNIFTPAVKKMAK